MSSLVARAFASDRITGGAVNRFRFKLAPKPFTLADMLRLVDALVAMNRDPDAILSSMAIAGARVDRGEGWLIAVEFGGVAERTVLDAAEVVNFWRRRARRQLARSGAAR